MRLALTVFLLAAFAAGASKPMTVSALLARGAELAGREVAVKGRVAEPFMTWACPKGAICKPTPPFAPVMIIADENAQENAPKRTLWVINCPAESTGFSPKTGDLVRVSGVVRAGGNLQLEHRETVFLSHGGKPGGGRWATPRR